MTRKIIEGNQALAIGAKLCRPKVIAAYPITPSTHVPETLSEFVSNGELDAEFINVESEHSAISACIGAQATGVRTFTATASQGLALMHEILYVTSGMRLPIVIGCANRSLSAPINIWGDHMDTMGQRDTGWIQLYAEDNQEALDLVIQAYKIAEDERVLLPAIIGIDAFTLTHTFEQVDIPDEEKVDAFLPPYKATYSYLDPKMPITQGSFATPEYYMEFKLSQQRAMANAGVVIDEVFEEFGKEFGRKYQKIEKYRTQDAEILLFAIGSMNGTAKVAVDRMRDKGIKVGLLKLTVFRPFPSVELREAVKNAKAVGIIERAISFGSQGPLFLETAAALTNISNAPKLYNFVVGLGGRDVRVQDFEIITDRTLDAFGKGEVWASPSWINVKEEVLP
jgi:pyruvate ferredoxin oxidoreductase alpha subunit